MLNATRQTDKSMTLRYQRKCFKVRYDTKGTAKKGMRKTNEQNDGEWKIKNVYYCDECAGWHLTSMEKERSRAIGKNLKTK